MNRTMCKFVPSWTVVQTIQEPLCHLNRFCLVFNFVHGEMAQTIARMAKPLAKINFDVI